MKTLLPALVILAGFFGNHDSQAGEPAPKAIPYQQLNSDYQILGETGHPLGSLLKLEGHIAYKPMKLYMGEPFLLVQRINGRATQDGFMVKLEPSDEWKKIKDLDRKSFEVKGYETGKYGGLTPEVLNEIGNGGASTGFGFRVHFNTIKHKEIPPIAFAPADLTDRYARFEGTATTISGNSYLQTKDWKLLVHEKEKWPAHLEGKFIESKGVIRKSKTSVDAYQITNSKSKLIKLEDQLGRDVELQGTLRSRSGELWIFEYRGQSIHVDRMDHIPGHFHGSKVNVTGILEKARLPKAEEILYREDVEKVDQFIIRKATFRLVPTWKEEAESAE